MNSVGGTGLLLLDPKTGAIRLTRAGIEKFGRDFVEAGFDPRTITTREAYEAAVDASFALKMRKLASSTRGADKCLDKALEGLPGWD